MTGVIRCAFALLLALGLASPSAKASASALHADLAVGSSGAPGSAFVPSSLLAAGAESLASASHRAQRHALLPNAAHAHDAEAPNAPGTPDGFFLYTGGQYLSVFESVHPDTSIRPSQRFELFPF